jgi:hypothetical protein
MPANTGWTGEKTISDRMAAQSEPQGQAAAAPQPRVRGDWEFLWRFIAVALLFALGWVVWIALQIHPPPIALPAAYEAAAKARANRNAEAQIRSADTAPAARSAPREPPVNVEKLKFSESIETAIPEHPEKSAKPRAQ